MRHRAGIHPPRKLAEAVVHKRIGYARQRTERPGQDRIHHEAIRQPQEAGTDVPTHPGSHHPAGKRKCARFLQRSCYIRGYIGRQAVDPHLSGEHQEGSDHKELEFDFENAYLSKGYYNWQENWNGDLLDIWATGNPGFKISNPSAKPEEYPTVMIEDGYQDKGVKLTTQRTSKLADMVHKPIAAGNLFIGQFDATDALRDAMKATKFGRPFSFSAKPEKLEGWYKYQAGEKFTDKDMNELNRHDYGTIYAVLYENIDENGNAVMLYGDNVQSSKQIVALALVGETRDDNGKTAIGNTPEWHHFSVDFDYQSYGKTIDPVKLKNGGYSLSIVCSSSSDGANFLGAVGSTLWVDSFKLICK